MVDQLSTATNQCITGVDQGQMSLGFLTSMLYGIEQLGIDPGQTGQLLGVELVGLALVAVDQPDLARVGHEHLVTAPFEQPAHPGEAMKRKVYN